MTDRAQAAAAVETTTGAFGRLDVLVNNAGYANVDSIAASARPRMRSVIAGQPVMAEPHLGRAAV